MTRHKLDNYLRTHRRRACFSQRDVAFLLGREDEMSVSRYEHGAHRPNLETILAFQVIFGIPLDDLFAGISEAAEREVRRRARKLLKMFEAEPRTRRTQRKIDALRRIADVPEADVITSP